MPTCKGEAYLSKLKYFDECFLCEKATKEVYFCGECRGRVCVSCQLKKREKKKQKRNQKKKKKKKQYNLEPQLPQTTARLKCISDPLTETIIYDKHRALRDMRSLPIKLLPFVMLLDRIFATCEDTVNMEVVQSQIEGRQS